MEKQQFAEKYANDHYGLLKADIDRIAWHTCYKQIIAGWEAREAQSENKAVAKIWHTGKPDCCEVSLVVTYKDDFPKMKMIFHGWNDSWDSRIVAWMNPEDLYELFNPSGEAPKAGSHAHIHVNLPAGGMATVSPDASPELLGALNKMVELAKGTPAPPAAGPVTGFAILYEALDNIAHSTAFPVNTEQPYEWIKSAQEMADKALKAYNSESRPPQPPAGPVWVKAGADSILSDKIIRNERTKVLYPYYLRHDLTTAYFEGRNDDIYVLLSELEYLDETAPAQQLFTREQVLTIAKFCMVKATTGDLKNFSDFLFYLDTNYPPLK